MNGLKSAFIKLKEMPLPSKISTDFTERLNELRNMVVADVQLQNNADLSKVNDKTEEKKSDTKSTSNTEDKLEALMTDGKSLE